MFRDVTWTNPFRQGMEFVIFLCMCIATTFSLHEFEFKAKWEELKRKRKVMKARKARKAKEAAGGAK